MENNDNNFSPKMLFSNQYYTSAGVKAENKLRINYDALEWERYDGFN